MPPILTLTDITMRFGAEPLFADVAVSIGAGDRLAVVGRNGDGKSTLLKVMAGDIQPDAGTRWVQPGLRIARLDQDVVADAAESVRGFVAAGPGAPAPHEIDSALAPFDLPADRELGSLSGGEARRAALARALAGAPDLLLLDEPTNHLDLPTIEWLESWLAAYRGAVVLISHDRALLERVATRALWLAGGAAHHRDGGLAGLAEWQDGVREAGALARHKLDRKLVLEQRWLDKGVTARRRRNQGRLRALQALRAERRAMAPVKQMADFGARGVRAGGRAVIEADGLCKAFDGRTVIKDFSVRILRGDRIAVTGANGAGKTTLIKLLSGEMSPDEGRVTLGADISPVVIDQRRAAVSNTGTVYDVLCPAGGDHVSVGGRRQHIAAFLSDFLFDPAQARSPVSSLSGGERNRLLLAMQLARAGTLLILDEPTNDLDFETLELLQEHLADYAGTVLLVSHDRAFMDRVATHTVWLAGDGRYVMDVGGYADIRANVVAAVRPKETRPRRATGAPAQGARTRRRLGYKDQRELDALPGRLERIAGEIKALEAELADPALFGTDRARFDAASAALAAVRARQEEDEARWLELAARDEELRAPDDT